MAGARVGDGPVLGLVLAAGGSSRMGRPKQLAELDGRPLLAHVLRALEDAPVDGVVVALGAHAAEVQARVDLGRAVPLVVRDWALGMGHVLASALTSAPARDHRASVVLLGDQPLVSGRSVARLVEAWRGGAGPVVTAAYGGRPGHPKLFDHRLLPELRRLSGDACRSCGGSPGTPAPATCSPPTRSGSTRSRSVASAATPTSTSRPTCNGSAGCSLRNP